MSKVDGSSMGILRLGSVFWEHENNFRSLVILVLILSTYFAIDFSLFIFRFRIMKPLPALAFVKVSFKRWLLLVSLTQLIKLVFGIQSWPLLLASFMSFFNNGFSILFDCAFLRTLLIFLFLVCSELRLSLILLVPISLNKLSRSWLFNPSCAVVILYCFVPSFLSLNYLAGGIHRDHMVRKYIEIAIFHSSLIILLIGRIMG
mmetsp:Transcript_11247/g.11195  ORF Transcript_11247/g.11195 Transcript_11247/m.11195 type:complete len:203 (-) Transcript_11247:90-698(-)